jgi:hypothetical protein
MVRLATLDTHFGDEPGHTFADFLRHAGTDG